jgi:prepilin-type N-terminal cleavage/methylation domain-containing protein
MKRAGFTMIELIFVIVIIGILSAVALPKFLGVASQAHLAKVKSYIGTFNMTTGPALWSEQIADGNGSIASVGDINVTNQLATPTEMTAITVSNCSSSFKDTNVSQSDPNTLTASNAFSSAVIGGKKYFIGCMDGNQSTSPRLWLDDQNGTVIAN